MIKPLSILGAALMLGACSQEPAPSKTPQSVKPAMDNQVTNLDYPKTKKGAVVDNYFETQVADPYRWLEDDLSLETGEWVKAQNKVTFGYLDNIPLPRSIKKTTRNALEL